MELLLSLSLKVDTPLFAGSWDPDKVDEDLQIRPQTIKGLWRWWARAYAAGALFDRGRLNERSSFELSKIVGLRAGLGYADPSGWESSASSYIIEVEGQGKVGVTDQDRRLQRVRLLTLGGRRLQYIREGSYFNLRVYRRGNIGEEGLKAGLGALLTALTLSGLGKGARRGLGCVSVKVEEGSKFEDFKRIDVNKEDSIRMLVEETRAAYASLIGEGEGARREEIAWMQAISDKVIDAVSGLRAFSLYALRGQNLLDNLHNFFVSTKRRDVIGKDEFRRRLAGWVLGLPRFQRQMGYKTDKVDRRASPFVLAVHGTQAYLSVFVSRDWPDTIKWFGGQRTGAGKQITEEISVDDKRLISAFNIARSTFEEYCKRSKIEYSVIWP
jgi:CRISPR-associated protein Cmr1